MKDLSDSAAKQLDEKKRAFDSAQNQAKEYHEALERAWVELAEQKKAYAALQVKHSANMKDLEGKLREEYQVLVLKQAKEAAERETSLAQSLHELRSAVSKTNERANWKEEEYNSEIQSLKARLQSAESRNEELASSVPDATRPLLRQIESLQAANNERMKVWEELERNLTSRLNESELRAQEAAERERQATDLYSEMVLYILS
jgi:hypothetical protein